MPEIIVIAVGSINKKYFRQAVDEYKKRISGNFRIKEIEIPETRLSQNPSKSTVEAALDKEADKIISNIPKKAFITALCIEGVKMDSYEFSKTLDDAALSGNSTFVFIIGSSFGLSNKIKSLSNLKLSLSPMTFPHQLFRVMLFEALYRAVNISNGGKYHK